MDSKQKKKAAALRFQSADQAPKVTARGEGALAEEIIRVARENGCPVVEDAALSELLAQLPVNQEIPENLYVVIAKLFASIYRLNRRL